MNKLLQVLEEKFGYTSFRPGQSEIIEAVLNQHDVLAMLPTGTGKSLCYQLPAYMVEGTVLVVSPLISLMQDQVEQLRILGEKKAVAINSFLQNTEKYHMFQNLHDYRFIFISPEMLSNEKVIKHLKNVNISLFVIDEAHCISQWGPDFRPDYLSVGKIRGILGNPPALALTATATKDVRKDIIHFLKLDSPKEFIFSVDRPNISMVVEKLDNSLEKRDRLREFIARIQKPGIIYFSSKRVAEETAEFLKAEGFAKVSVYHGGMDQEQRILIQQQFLYDQLQIICATSAFGMGVNKENIRFVIHYHPPAQLESYLQEIGRAGRDGKPSIAVLLYTRGDEQIPKRLIESELPDDNQIDRYFQLANIKKQEELIQELQLSETQLRFLAFYYNNKVSVADVRNICQERMEYKQKKLVQMISWIHSEYCRREQIYSYFDEDCETVPAQCCDICSIEVDQYFETNKQISSERETTWQHNLRLLLLGSD